MGALGPFGCTDAGGASARIGGGSLEHPVSDGGAPSRSSPFEGALTHGSSQAAVSDALGVCANGLGLRVGIEQVDELVRQRSVLADQLDRVRRHGRGQRGAVLVVEVLRHGIRVFAQRTSDERRRENRHPAGCRTTIRPARRSTRTAAPAGAPPRRCCGGASCARRNPWPQASRGLRVPRRAPVAGPASGTRRSCGWSSRTFRASAVPVGSAGDAGVLALRSRSECEVIIVLVHGGQVHPASVGAAEGDEGFALRAPTRLPPATHKRQQYQLGDTRSFATPRCHNGSLVFTRWHTFHCTRHRQPCCRHRTPRCSAAKRRRRRTRGGSRCCNRHPRPRSRRRSPPRTG